MIRNALFTLVALCTVLNIQAQTSSSFTINGKIPGLKAGYEVKLTDIEYGRRKTIATTTSTDGGFRLEGSVASPTLCWLDINGENFDAHKQFDLMVEQGTTDITANHIDSLPPSFTVTTDKLLKERNLSVAGGKAQQEFAEYRAAMLPYEIAAKEIHYELYHAPGAERENTMRHDSLQALLDKADEKIRLAQLDFITLHPDYSISAYQWCLLLQEPFSFTNEELDRVLELTANNRDTVRMAQLRKFAEQSRKCVRGIHYTDFDALDADKQAHRLSEYVAQDRYTLIDFWASWCSPCRAAIPHVRKFYQQHAGKLNVCSVSLDQKEPDWRRALEEEKMEWTQLWLPKEKQKTATSAYSIHGIPFLLLISPQGEILYAGNSAADASEAFGKHIDGQTGRTN